MKMQLMQMRESLFAELWQKEYSMEMGMPAMME